MSNKPEYVFSTLWGGPLFPPAEELLGPLAVLATLDKGCLDLLVLRGFNDFPPKIP